MKKWLDINANTPEEARVLILGIPFDGGTSQEAGAAEGPAKIREFGEVYMPGTFWTRSRWFMISAMWI